MRKTKKKSAGAVLWLAFAACLTVLLSVCIIFTVFSSNGSREQSDAPDFIGDIAVHTDYIPKDSPARPGTKRTVQYIVIHETDNTGAHATAKAHNDYIHENCWKEQKSWHYTVDDTEIWHHLPDNEMGYHAGDRRQPDGGNTSGIGIELCVNAGGDFDKTMRNAAELTAYLLIKHDLSLHAVKQHRDFSGKICPQTIIRQNKWNDFLNLVQQAYDAQRIENTQQGA